MFNYMPHPVPRSTLEKIPSTSEQRCSINVGNIFYSFFKSIYFIGWNVPFPPNPIAFGLIFSLDTQIFGPRSACTLIIFIKRKGYYS
jgi:hypothetical protein